MFAHGSGGPGYKGGRRVGDRERKIFSEKLWGSHFVVLIREMDARAALGPSPSSVVCNHLLRCRVPGLRVGVYPREVLRLITET